MKYSLGHCVAGLFKNLIPSHSGYNNPTPLPVVLTTTLAVGLEAHDFSNVFDLFDGINYLFLILLSLYHFLVTLSVPAGIKFQYNPDGSGGKDQPFPDSPTLENYVRVFKSSFIWTGYMNTIIRTVLGTSLQLVATSLSALCPARILPPQIRSGTFFLSLPCSLMVV